MPSVLGCWRGASGCCWPGRRSAGELERLQAAVAEADEAAPRAVIAREETVEALAESAEEASWSVRRWIRRPRVLLGGDGGGKGGAPHGPPPRTRRFGLRPDHSRSSCTPAVRGPHGSAGRGGARWRRQISRAGSRPRSTNTRFAVRVALIALGNPQ